MGTDRDWRVALVGTGNLGRALLGYRGFGHQGFRIVGTTEEMFTQFEYQEGRKLTPRPGGRVFDPGRREAVIGSTVALKTGLAVGSMFNPYHGLDYDEGKRHEDQYVVVGVTAPPASE